MYYNLCIFIVIIGKERLPRLLASVEEEELLQGLTTDPFVRHNKDMERSD